MKGPRLRSTIRKHHKTTTDSCGKYPVVETSLLRFFQAKKLPNSSKILSTFCLEFQTMA
jgi:hypothetical protein